CNLVATSTSRSGATPPARLIVGCSAITSPHLGNQPCQSCAAGAAQLYFAARVSVRRKSSRPEMMMAACYADRARRAPTGARTGVEWGLTVQSVLPAREQVSPQSVCEPAPRLVPRHNDRSAVRPHPAGAGRAAEALAGAADGTGLAGSAGLLPVFFLASPRPA